MGEGRRPEGGESGGRTGGREGKPRAKTWISAARAEKTPCSRPFRWIFLSPLLPLGRSLVAPRRTIVPEGGKDRFVEMVPSRVDSPKKAAVTAPIAGRPRPGSLVSGCPGPLQ